MYRKTLFLILLLMGFNSFNAQPSGMMQFEGKVDGYIFDLNANVPLEYANIVLFSLKDSSQVTGTVTNNEGYFSMNLNRPGMFYMRVGFIGYEDTYVDSIKINRDNPYVGFEKLTLSAQSYDLEDVVVTGESAPITYQIDKKVINVSQQITSSSGTAIDVLQNVPSVSVDIEGNVSLRGSGSFQVLIDGRPTLLSGSEALEQIPASSIENIELITNPSAKYNPEGTAGIINVILKKNSLEGMSGVLDFNGGLNDQYGGEGIFDYKNNNYQFNFALDYNSRFFDMESREDSRTVLPDFSSTLNSIGTSTRGRESYGIRGSYSIDVGSNNFFTVGGRYGNRDGKMNGNSFYTRSLSNSNEIESYFNSSTRKRGGDFYAFNLNYQHKFRRPGHEITGELYYERSNADEDNITTISESNIITDGQQLKEYGPDNEYRIKFDYILPFTEKSKFEAGYQGEFELSEESIDVFDYDIQSNSFVFQDLFSNQTEYNDEVHAAYSIYSGDVGFLSYQFGMRAENTYRNIKLIRTGESFELNEWDYFPSAHMSSKIAEGHQVMASYTRRIQRPRGWELEPFDTWIDAYNVRRGNPSLKPEYIDSYELGYQTILGKSIFSVESYYRVNNNKIERIRSVYEQDVNLITMQNVGKSYSLGAEVMFNFDPVKNWNVNLMGDLYDYKIEGIFNNQDFSRNSFSWSARLNNIIKISDVTQIQFNGMYNSPIVSSQGEIKAFYMANIAVKQDLFDKQLSLTLQVRDLFKTMKHENLIDSGDIYRFSVWEPESPFVSLNVKFNFNNYKSKDRRSGNTGMNGMEDEF